MSTIIYRISTLRSVVSTKCFQRLALKSLSLSSTSSLKRTNEKLARPPIPNFTSSDEKRGSASKKGLLVAGVPLTLLATIVYVFFFHMKKERLSSENVPEYSETFKKTYVSRIEAVQKSRQRKQLDAELNASN